MSTSSGEAAARTSNRRKLLAIGLVVGLLCAATVAFLSQGGEELDLETIGDVTVLKDASSKSPSRPEEASLVGLGSELVLVGNECLGIVGNDRKQHTVIWPHGTSFSQESGGITVTFNEVSWRLGETKAYELAGDKSLEGVDVPKACSEENGVRILNFGE